MPSITSFRFVFIAALVMATVIVLGPTGSFPLFKVHL